MFKLLKYLPLVTLFKDVSEQWQAETGSKRNLLLQRTFVGAVIALISGFLSIEFGVQITHDDIKIAADNITQIASVAGAIYGAALSIYGVAMKVSKAVKNDKSKSE